jgi:hypothetical protein
VDVGDGVGGRAFGVAGDESVEVAGEVARELQHLADRDPPAVFALDLEARRITCGGLSAPVRLGEGRRQQLIEGTWDSTAVLLAAADAVVAMLGGRQRT